MNRLEKQLKITQERKEKAFVAYIMAGEHGLVETKNQIQYLIQCGVDVIELGVPFSDPVADGPIITEAGQRALSRNINVRAILQMVKEVREFTDVPIVLMSYLNPIYQYGLSDFFIDASQCGIDGIILPDVPFEESDSYYYSCEREGLCYIQLISLTSSEKRMNAILKRAKGFIYSIALTGITGTHETYERNIFHLLEKIKKNTTIPVFAGFGVSTTKHVQQFTNVCDGVIVGSKIIELFNQNKKIEIKKLIESKAIKEIVQ